MPDEKRIITLEEARLLREQLRPAFAGYVTDGNISDRDVLATILDLVARGAITPDMDSQKKPVEIRGLYKNIEGKELLPVERAFIRAIFAENPYVDKATIVYKIRSHGLHELLKEYMWSLTEFKVVRPTLMLVDKDGKRRDSGYFTDTGSWRQFKTPHDLDNARATCEWRMRMARMGLVTFLIFFVIIFLLALNYRTTSDKYKDYGLEECNDYFRPFLEKAVIGSGEYLPEPYYSEYLDCEFDPPAFFMNKDPDYKVGWMNLDFAGITVYVFMFLLLLLAGSAYYYTSDRKTLKDLNETKKLMAVKFSEAVPYVKGKYEDLFDFIQAMPLTEQRIYNEFMPFAVAFGLDTSWHQSFGLAPETPVVSRRLDELPDNLRKQVSEDEAAKEWRGGDN